jgi:hypothetical protein
LARCGIWRCGLEALSDNFNHRGNKVAAITERRRRPRDPDSLKFHFLVTRVGSWDGYALVETDDISVHQEIASSYPSLSFKIEPVIDVNDSTIFEDRGMAIFAKAAEG